MDLPDLFCIITGVKMTDLPDPFSVITSVRLGPS